MPSPHFFPCILSPSISCSSIFTEYVCCIEGAILVSSTLKPETEGLSYACMHSTEGGRKSILGLPLREEMHLRLFVNNSCHSEGFPHVVLPTHLWKPCLPLLPQPHRIGTQPSSFVHPNFSSFVATGERKGLCSRLFYSWTTWRTYSLGSLLVAFLGIIDGLWVLG